jgi:hypothetical protein
MTRAAQRNCRITTTHLDDLVGGAGEDCGQLLQAGQQVQDVWGVREGQVLNAEKSKC